MKFTLLSALFLVCFSIGNAQTTYTIDFSYKSLGTSCNVFSVDKNVDNYIHQSTIGFSTFVGNPDYYVNLQCKRNSSTTQVGTEYQVLFPFKKDYKYQINAYYRGTVTSGSEFYPMLAFGFNTTKKTQNTSTSCSGPQAISSSGYTTASTGSNFAWSASPIVSTITLTQNYESLSVGSIPWPNNSATGVQNVQVRKIQITEIPPPITNDESTGAITLTPSTNVSCVQQTSASFGSATIAQSPYYENVGCPFSNTRIADVWYKFTATNNTHAITVSDAPSGYNRSAELYSYENSTFRLVDVTQPLSASSGTITSSGLNVGHVYYVRLVLGSETTQNKNVNLNICVTTPIIGLADLKVEACFWLGLVEDATIIDNGMTLNVAYQLPQSIPESDLSFDWKIIPDGVNPGFVDGLFLYAEGTSPINNGLNGISNVQSRRIKVGLDSKSPTYAGYNIWGAYLGVRIKQISTNTYLTGWINDGQFFRTEL